MGALRLFVGIRLPRYRLATLQTSRALTLTSFVWQAVLIAAELAGSGKSLNSNDVGYEMPFPLPNLTQDGENDRQV
jgi:hypothetical protein